MEFSKLPLSEALQLKAMAGLTASYHLFDKDQIAAIMTAWYAKRPLLIRGDPGLGKSQIAHAIAQSQNWNLLVHVVNSHTEPDDLLFRVDPVARLAKAQLIKRNEDIKTCLDEKRFVVPGPIWWAYAAKEAKKFFTPEQSDFNTNIEIDCCKPSVLLIDEIDKADSELPNALLEVLNNHSFSAYGHDEKIQMDIDKRPFIVITSNDQNPLPAAFLRRCVCLNLSMKSQEQGGIEQLIKIAEAHKPDIDKLSSDIIAKAAKLVIEKRSQKSLAGEYTPSTSEFLDLLRVLNSEQYQDDDARSAALTDIAKYILNK
jgi:MoxR-like ATPase